MNPMWALLALDLLDTIVTLMKRGKESAAEIEIVRAKVRQMIVEDRDPEPEELRVLALKSRLLSIRLKAARDSARE